MHLIWGAEVDPALRPVLLVTLMGSLAGSSAWNFMGIWAVKELGATSTQLSYGYLLMAAVGGVVGYGAGHLSDHFGRRRVILFGQGILAVYVLLFLTVGGNIWFGLGLMVGAAGLGSFGGSAGQAMVADLVPPDRHEEAYASVRVAANLGVTMGPPIGSLFLLIGGWTLFFPCVSLLALSAWFLAFRYLPKRGAYAPEGPPERGSLKVIVHDRTFLVFMLASVFAWVVYVAYETVLPISLVESHGVPTWAWGFLLVVNPILVTFFQLRLTRRVTGVPAARRWVVAMLLMGLPFLFLGVSSLLPVILVVLVLFVIGEMLWVPGLPVGRRRPRAGGSPRRLHGCVRRDCRDGIRARAVHGPAGAGSRRRHGDVGRLRSGRSRRCGARRDRHSRRRQPPQSLGRLCCT